MSVNVVTRLNFRGDARAALEFYQSVFGGDLSIHTYRDMGNVEEPAEADQVIWGQLVAGGGVDIMAADLPSRLPWSQGENSFYMALRGNTAEEINACWEKLSDGSTVIQPLEPSRWATLYGMLKDRFGITWIVEVVGENSAS